MSNEIVKFSNQFNNVALKKFDAVHLDVLMAIASRVREKGTATVEFSFEELRGLMRLRKNLTNRQLADKIVQTNARLLALNYMFEDSGKIIQFALFTKFVTDPQEATLAVGVNEEFAFLLNDLTSQFTRFELAEFADLKSKYAKEFYRRAKQYRSSGIWKISRDEFCRLLSVPKSTAEQVRDLNKRVLKPIIEECGPLLGLKIERQYVKRRLSGFVFTFARETPPVIDARPVEARKTDGDGKGHWTSVAGYGEVFTTTELFDVTAARDHFDGTVEAGECRFCAFDARNREHHARNAGRLYDPSRGGNVDMRVIDVIDRRIPRLPRSETTTGTAAAASRTVQATAPQPAHAQPQSFTPNPQRIEHRAGAQQPDRWA